MTTHPTHTPTPWQADLQGTTIHIQSISAGYTVALIESCTDTVYSQDEINAAFIVRAVNCHKELLKQLKIAHGEMLADGWSHESLEEVEAIIAKAEGK